MNNKLGRLRAFVSFLAFLFLFSHLPVHAKAQITPEQVKQAVQEIQKLCEKAIAEGAVPGLAIAVVFQDQVVYAAGFGVRNVDKQEPINADTVFQLASLSKPIGSTLVAKLVGEGKISWDSKISALDPDFMMYDPWVTREVTIRDFYSHRSGLPDHSGDLLEDLGFTREEILHRLRYQKPDSSFRSHYAYTNFGITEAAVAATRAYNMTWENAIMQKLYRPLAMNSTSSRYADFVARKNKALGHSGAFALGAATAVQLIPSKDLAVVVLTNACPVGVAEGLVRTFTDVALYGKATRDWFALFKKVFADPATFGVFLGTDYSKPPASPAPALANSAYLGAYTNNYFGDIQIIEESGGLAIIEGPHKLTFPLQHYDRDLFTCKTEGENAVGATGITFTIGADGSFSN